MVSPTNPNDDDFYARALASFNQQMAIANNNDAATKEVEQYAKSLVDDDHPKIDGAVKSYLSLVAARSAVASDIDVLPDSLSTKDIVQCTFATSNKSMDANRCSLMCARTLLSTINSTTIPTDFEKGVDTSTINEDEEVDNNEEDKMKTYMQDNTTKILWNRLVVQSNSSTGDKEKAKQTKPSKVIGRASLLVAYPYIQERFRRGIILSSEDGGKVDTTSPSAAEDDGIKANNPLQSLSNEVLQPVNPPKGIELDQWKAFYTEFGQLLSRACINDNENEDTEEQIKAEQHDDSALIWSADKGKSELQSRRESRAKRASNALSSVEDAKTTITEALGGGDGEVK